MGRGLPPRPGGGGHADRLRPDPRGHRRGTAAALRGGHTGQGTALLVLARRPRAVRPGGRPALPLPGGADPRSPGCVSPGGDPPEPVLARGRPPDPPRRPDGGARRQHRRSPGCAGPGGDPRTPRDAPMAVLADNTAAHRAVLARGATPGPPATPRWRCSPTTPPLTGLCWPGGRPPDPPRRPDGGARRQHRRSPGCAGPGGDPRTPRDAPMAVLADNTAAHRA